MVTLETVLRFENALREEWRLKRNVDYAFTYKYGNIHLLCCDVFKETICEEAKKHGFTFDSVATYFVHP